MKMTCPQASHPSNVFIGLLLVFAAATARAQLSLTTAVDLALHNSPKVAQAAAEVDRARAGVAEAKDVYVPSIGLSSQLGKSFGFPLGQPSVFSVTGQSLVFNYSQRDYIRGARYGFDAATLSLMDARQSVAADTALTYVAVEHDQQRHTALGQELEAAQRLVQIVSDRLDAGRENAIDLTSAKLTVAQIHLAQLRSEDELNADLDHMARLVNLPTDTLRVAEEGFPAIPDAQPVVSGSRFALKPQIQAAYANATSKAAQAHGDARYLYRPQISFAGTYSLFSNELNNYSEYYQHFQYNNGGVGIQINFPILDREHLARARASAAAATSALREADFAEQQELDAQAKLFHATTELRAQAEVAQLDQQLARQQLDALTAQLDTSSSNSSGPQLSPKDEQNSRIAEREKYLALIDANFQLRQAQINLLRETGQIESWLQQSLRTAPARP